jgi:hypothetical protein
MLAAAVLLAVAAAGVCQVGCWHRQRLGVWVRLLLLLHIGLLGLWVGLLVRLLLLLLLLLLTVGI